MSVFSKMAAPFNRSQLLNTANLNDSVVGGVITGSPPALTPGATGSAYYQNFPGDRFLFGPQDAYAISNNAVGNLYVGAYRYLQFRNNATANVKLGRGLFWDPTVGGNLTGANISNNGRADGQFLVTTDGNSANYTNTLLAAVAINNITLGNTQNWFWFAQESGKATLQFVAALTGTGAIGSPVFVPLTAAANNNATDNGAFDVLAGGNSAAAFAANSTTAYTQVGQMIQNYVGVAEVSPSNNNLSIVDMTMQRTSFRMTAA
jgi:hypothetical protein